MSHDNDIRSWSDLPVDILSVIMEHLYFDDQIRFRTVCKSWRWNTYVIKYADQLPWLFAYEDDRYDQVGGFCYLYNPSNKTRYEIKKKLPFQSVFHDSKYGWILISKEEMYVPPFHSLFFFYNPFSDETIKLSVFKYPLPFHIYKVIFSGNPTSKECVIFLVFIDNDSNSLGLMKIYTCKPGDTRWTLHYCLEGFRGHIIGLACVDGVLYCASHSSRFEGENILLSSFQIIAKEKKIVLDKIDVLCFANPSSCFANPSLYSWDIGGSTIIEWEGNVLLTYYKDDDSCLVFRVDFSEKRLVEFENLEKKMLFWSSEKSILVPAVGAASDLANTVHRNVFMKFKSVFYKAPKTHWCPQPYGWIKKPEVSCPMSIWIQPPLHFTRSRKITTPVHSIMIGSIRVPIRIPPPSPSL